jgi:hypothetical protein
MPNGHDRNWVRVCAAVDGFYIRYNRWPTRVRLFPVALADLRDHLFTPDDYARITSKVSLIPDDAPVIAEDDTGASYNYGKESFPKRRPSLSAEEWFGVSPKQEA